MASVSFRDIHKAYGKVKVIHGIGFDITDGEFVDQLADRSKQEMGKVTLWVSNAGGADDRTPRHLADMPDRQWDYQMDLNLRAVFTGARAAARVLEDGGSIINISSVPMRL